LHTLKVASRKSALAMQQSNWVLDQVRRQHPSLVLEIIPIVTQGDKILNVTLSKVGGKGLFVSEIEACLLSKQADFAVHSLKDVPAVLANGLTLAAMPAREDARDALISKRGLTFRDLPTGALLGTSSLRRMAQLQAARPDLRFESIRGNIDTRLKKLQTENFDAIVLAAAGLHRMGWADVITEYLDTELCLPAIGQGILGIECRSEDVNTVNILSGLRDERTMVAAEAERTLLHLLNGGCQVPIGGYAEVDELGTVSLRGMVASADGQEILRAHATGRDAVAVGTFVAEQLRLLGADRLIQTSVAL
jgi:hydroxymethylbilane synthase